MIFSTQLLHNVKYSLLQRKAPGYELCLWISVGIKSLSMKLSSSFVHVRNLCIENQSWFLSHCPESYLY